MPVLRESNTTIVERNEVWRGPFATEPCEAAWAAEAIYFVRALDAHGPLDGATAHLQLSPDGMHWCDEGTTIRLSSEAGGVAFGRARHFGGWLRLVGELPPAAELRVIVYLVLKA